MHTLLVIESAMGSLATVAACDRLMTTRCGACFTDFDYRYFPLSKIRISTIVLLAAAVLFVFLSADPEHPPVLPFALAVAALAIHGAVALIDLYAQRRTGYRTPLNYGEREEI